MRYLVEAYLSYDDFLNGENVITFIFKDKDEFERLRLETSFIYNLYVVGKGEVYNIDCSESDSENSI